MNDHPFYDQMQPDSVKYFQAFGLFIHRYAQVEAVIHAYFRHITGLPDGQARVISSAHGSRLSDLTELTKRLLDAKKADKQLMDEVNTIFGQLRLITNLRNKLVHRIAVIKGDTVTLSNERVARVPEEADVLTTNSSQITAAILDLGAMWLRIVHLIRPLNKDMDTDVYNWMYEPWLYKP